MRWPVDQEIRDLITRHGRITFAQFMQLCLYSPCGGFYASRAHGISSHFGTSAMSHPVFGALIARQLEQMWRLLGEPSVFHAIEVGSGDGALAQSIVQACACSAPRFAGALRYVAADYAPRWLHSSDHALGWWARDTRAPLSAERPDGIAGIERVRSEGVEAFGHVVGCILSNELLDNFPVHRFAIQGGSVKEIYVTLADGKLTEVLDEPSSPCIEQRLADLKVSLAEGYRGEVSLGLEHWSDQLARALDRGFVLTIDYGELAHALYAPANSDGTLVCYRSHSATNDPYVCLGQQDITCHVDFTSLMRFGKRHGLATVGYTRQGEFLTNLGFSSFVDAPETRSGVSDARATLNRMAMMTLVDPDEYGNLKVLAQAKGVEPGIELLGFSPRKV
jgi:SAM-dependent MidA family methyltransferase